MRLAQPLARQVLLVAAVAGFVHRAHQAAQEAVERKTRGHAHVFRHATAEGVGAHIQPAGLEIEAQDPHHLLAQPALAVQRERAHRVQGRVLRLALTHRADQAGQPLPHLAEDLIHPRAGHAGLEVVHQRVVTRQAGALGQQRGPFACQRQHRAEVDQKARPVVGRALAAPGVFAARGGDLLALHQVLGQRGGAPPVAADLAQVGALFVAQRLLRGTLDLLAQRRVGAQAVQQRRHLGHRRRAGLVALAGHVGGLVPAGDGLQVAQAVQPGVGGRQGVVGGCVHGL